MLAGYCGAYHSGDREIPLDLRLVANILGRPESHSGALSVLVRRVAPSARAGGRVRGMRTLLLLKLARHILARADPTEFETFRSENRGFSWRTFCGGITRPSGVK